LESWRHYRGQIQACDRQINAVLDALGASLPAVEEPLDPPGTEPPASPGAEPVKPTPKKAGVNAPDIAGLGRLLIRLQGGRDLTRLPACTSYALLQLIAEVGLDLSVWPSRKHFTSWLGLAPGSHQSGKRRRGVGRKRNRAGRLLCVIVRSLARSKDIALGGFYRRMRARKGGLLAIVATARKLGELIWDALVKGMDYVEKGLKQYEERVLETQVRTLERLAKKLGVDVIPRLSATKPCKS
jgi:hypothetical protein